MFTNSFSNSSNLPENSKNYYCHQCQNQFNKSILEDDPPQRIECKSLHHILKKIGVKFFKGSVCKGDFCEEMSQTAQTLRMTSSFSLPFIVRNPVSIRRVLSNGQMIIEFMNFSNIRFPSQSMSFNNDVFTHHFDQILNHLMLNDSKF